MGNKFNLNKEDNIIIYPLFLKKNIDIVEDINYQVSYREYLYNKDNWWKINYNINDHYRLDIILYMYKLCKKLNLEKSVFNLSVIIFDKIRLYINNDFTIVFIYSIVSIIISNKYIDDSTFISFYDIIDRYRLKIDLHNINLVEQNILKILDYRLSLVRIDTLIYYYFDILCIEDNNIKNLKKEDILKYKIIINNCVKMTDYVILDVSWNNYNLLLLSLSIILFNYNNFENNIINTINIKFFFNIFELYYLFNYYDYSREITNIFDFLINCEKIYKKKLKLK